MKLIRKITLFLFVVLLSVSLVSYVDYSSNECSIENVAFKGGEHIVFKAYYNWGFIWIPAGEATFDVKESKDFFEIFVWGTSYPSYDGFFKLRDRFYSKLDKKSMLPLIFEREVNEGDYQKYEKITFDQKKKTASVIQGKTQKTASNSTFKFDHCMHDLLSLMYYLRNINADMYKKGEAINASIFFDKEVFPIKVRYQGKENSRNVKGNGNFKALRVVPDVIAGSVFNAGDKMTIWVTDDRNKLPLEVSSPLKVGSLKAVLKSYSGLRSGMTSKIN